MRKVRNRAETGLKLAEDDGNLLSIALDHLMLGRTYLLDGRLSQEASAESQETEKGSALDTWLSALGHAEKHFSESVSQFRQAGIQDMLSRGLLHRAALWRAILMRSSEFGMRNEDDDSALPTPQSALERAKRDLDEVESIAERGSMLIFQIEAALERTRLALVLNDSEEARRKLDETRALIKKTESPYEPHVPEWDDWEPPKYIDVIKKGEIVGYHRRNHEIERLQQAIDQRAS